MKKNIVTLTEDTCKVLGELNSKGKHSSQTSPIKEEDLQGFKRIRKFIPMLEQFHLICDNPNRDLHFDQYISFILFYFFNPVLTSLRGIQQASHLEKVKKVLGVKGTSLTSLSEASHVFDANLIVPLIRRNRGQHPFFFIMLRKGVITGNLSWIRETSKMIKNGCCPRFCPYYPFTNTM
ncbi:MAG: hypothetical protein ABH886_00835, partial [Candidatus Desantisbacteria bacterium]